MFILIASARPKMVFEIEKISDQKILTIEIHSDLKYASAEYLKDKIFEYVLKNKEIDIVVLQGKEIFCIDSTVGFVSIDLTPICWFSILTVIFSRILLRWAKI